MPSLLAEYLAYLTDNRRLSPHSVRAYHATADRLTGFLQLHWGTDVTRETLRKVSAADMRAFLADRRGDGLTNRSTARELSATRHFLRFALGDDVTLPVMKGPRVQRSLPRYRERLTPRCETCRTGAAGGVCRSRSPRSCCAICRR